jgi:hypothetical protein
MKQKLLFLIALFCFLKNYAQTIPLSPINPPREHHANIRCDEELVESSCNLIPNPVFFTKGDSLEDFSEGAVPGWRDVNNLTTDVNGALAINMGWNLPAHPPLWVESNYASMLVDNYSRETEGIAAKIFQLVAGNNYAFSFFLSSSKVSNYRASDGTFKFKIYLAYCQNSDRFSPGNPEILGEKQLIFCRSFEKMGDTNWQQYFINFKADDKFNMIFIYPEIPEDLSDAGTYLHFLYPELVPINPTHQYVNTNEGGLTYLSACGVTNASYEWKGPAGVVSNLGCDVLGYETGAQENDGYTFSMWVEKAMGNNPESCNDVKPETVHAEATQLPTTERAVFCLNTVTPTNSCNIIPNASFALTPGDAIYSDQFRQGRVDAWASINNSAPFLQNYFPPGVTSPSAYIPINTSHTGYFYGGIYAKISQQIVAGRKYAFSVFINNLYQLAISPPADYTLKVALSNNCESFPFISSTEPPGLGPSQNILCQKFPWPNPLTAPVWHQYVVTFTADADYSVISIFTEGNFGNTGFGYACVAVPELIDVTNLITVTQNSTCNYTLKACAVTNATFSWVDGNSTILGNGSQITVNSAIRPEPYTVTVSIPNIVNNTLLNNLCSVNTGTIIAKTPLWNQAVWVGGNLGGATAWNNPGNWNPAVVPNDMLTDVIITPATNRPTIAAGEAYQVHSITIQSGGRLINYGTLKIAANINAGPASITNYNAGVVSGSIEMNGPCYPQTITGNVFDDADPNNGIVGNDVNNFTAGNNVTISAVAGQGLDVYGELGFGTALSKTLTTGNNLTLVSNSSKTANVAKIDASNFISGAATVERYINTGTGGVQYDHAAKWQALATPTGANSIGQNVRQSWMENGLVTSIANGYGTNIPDPRSNWSALGFDQLATNGTTAIKTYNSGTNLFDPIASTGIPLWNKKGYFLFVRGDRSKTLFTSSPNPTNLRSKGALFQPYTGYSPPSVTVPLTVPGSPTIWKFEMIGNPYASPISIDYMKNHGNFTNLTNDVLVWDPLLAGSQGLGGYQTLHASNGYKPTPGGTALYDVNVGYPDIQSGQAFFVGTLDNSTPGLVTFDEAIKSTNYRLVTRQSATVTKSFRANLYYGANICDGNAILFGNNFKNDIDADDAGKFLNPGENFMIIKGNRIPLAVEARQQIRDNDSVFYAFSNLRKETYQLRFMPENMQEEGLYAVLVDNYLHQRIPLKLSENSFVNFVVDDSKASFENRFFVIFEKNSQSHSSEAGGVNRSTGETGPGSISVYPNPVKDKIINIHYSGMPVGRYNVQLINHTGQVSYKSQVTIKENKGSQSIIPGKKIASGSYQLIFIDESGKKYSQQVIL